MTRPANAFQWKTMATPGTEHVVAVGKTRCFVVQQIDGLVRVTSGHRIARARSCALQVGGTILVPTDSVEPLIRMLRQASRGK